MRSTTSASAPTPFTLCPHGTPPTPRPASAPPPNYSSSPVQPAYPHRCLACTVAYLSSSQNLILDTYNGLIREQRGRLLIATERRGTDRETRFDDEMVGIGRGRIEEWEGRREREVDAVWAGFTQIWSGGKRFVERDERGNGGGLVLMEGTLEVWLQRMRDGGMRVRGL